MRRRLCAGPPQWRIVAKLTAESPTPDARFGNASAVDGGILAVGAYKDSEKALQAGAVHIFERDGSNTWVEVAKLMASDGDLGDLLGRQAVAISDWTVVAGAIESGITGAAYVFERDGTGVWAEAAKLTPSDADPGLFGTSVAIYGDLIVVGHEHEDVLGDATGAAYLFQRQTDGSWLEVAKLKASDGAELDEFGRAVAAGPATAIVGAVNDDDAGYASGSAYVFLEREVGREPDCDARPGEPGLRPLRPSAGPRDLCGERRRRSAVTPRFASAAPKRSGQTRSSSSR
jgi:hypothetical protein